MSDVVHYFIAVDAWVLIDRSVVNFVKKFSILVLIEMVVVVVVTMVKLRPRWKNLILSTTNIGVGYYFNFVS